mmetsp:Transcript_6276/g.15454  ORF Transcript_6276/g.15454 Transcript_6276/m.15454 type:complete len:181 (-) Transcript_6276:131-673(-)
MAGRDITIREADSASDIEKVRQLISAFYDELDENLDFQGIDGELQSLPGKYSKDQNGNLLVVDVKSNEGEVETVGCVAIKNMTGKITDEDGNMEDASSSPLTAEVKRLFVLPEYRSLKLGRLLMHAIEEKAKEQGYRRLILDSLRRLEAAVALYKRLGYSERKPYYHNPLDGVVYMTKEL